MASPSQDLIQEQLGRRTIACLATHNDDGSIQLTAVWFLYEEGHIYVATASRSRKARNLKARPAASFMVDARDPGSERGVCATCSAATLTGDKAAALTRRIHQRYLSEKAQHDPRVGGVFAAIDDIVIEMTPTKWTTWDMRTLGKQLFGDAAGTPGYFLPLE